MKHFCTWRRSIVRVLDVAHTVAGAGTCAVALVFVGGCALLPVEARTGVEAAAGTSAERGGMGSPATGKAVPGARPSGYLSVESKRRTGSVGLRIGGGGGGDPSAVPLIGKLESHPDRRVGTGEAGGTGGEGGKGTAGGVGDLGEPIRSLARSDDSDAGRDVNPRSKGGLMKKPVASGRMTSTFGLRRGRRHNGVDYAAPVGTEVLAAADGVVEDLRYSESYGNYVRIRHTGLLSTAYAHLSEFAKGLEIGSSVRHGDTIGEVGATGRASGPHLHYEVISGGVFVNPLLVGR